MVSTGQLLIRNICMCFDVYLRSKARQQFSQGDQAGRCRWKIKTASQRFFIETVTCSALSRAGTQFGLLGLAPGRPGSGRFCWAVRISPAVIPAAGAATSYSWGRSIPSTAGSSGVETG